MEGRLLCGGRSENSVPPPSLIEFKVISIQALMNLKFIDSWNWDNNLTLPSHNTMDAGFAPVPLSHFLKASCLLHCRWCSSVRLTKQGEILHPLPLPSSLVDHPCMCLWRHLEVRTFSFCHLHCTPLSKPINSRHYVGYIYFRKYGLITTLQEAYNLVRMKQGYPVFHSQYCVSEQWKEVLGETFWCTLHC